jgi:CRP/FNR family transcriptional regulator
VNGNRQAQQIAIGATLRQTRLFSGLSPQDLAIVAEGCSLRTLAKGQTLFREGQRADGFYVLHSGRIGVYKVSVGGREQTICVFNPPESFAEVTLATMESYPANAVAVTDSQVIVVNRSHFRELVRRQPELALNMLGSMSLHLKHLVQSLQDLKALPIEYRLCDWLLRQSPAAAAGCPVVVDLPVTKKVLAAQLSVTSETLSRTFARLTREGLIIVRGPRIQIVDGKALRDYAQP